MSEDSALVVGGLDVGSECIKAVVLSGRDLLGRSVVQNRGYFQDRIHDALTGALQAIAPAGADKLEPAFEIPPVEAPLTSEETTLSSPSLSTSCPFKLFAFHPLSTGR